MSLQRRAYLVLHFCIVLWGFTAILGKVIDMSALWLVAWRMVITSSVLMLLPKVLSSLRQISRRTLLQLVGIGVIVSLHWLCFYGSIKLANASVALVTLATTSFFTAIAEPILTRSPFRRYELLLGLTIIPGIWLITESLPVKQISGVYVGILSSVLVAFFSSFNKLMVEKAYGPSITFVELGSGGLFLTLVVVAANFWQGGDWAQISHEASAILQPSRATALCGVMPAWPNWLYMLLLSVFCTALPFALSLYALKHISAFSANLALNLEPVYGVLLAIPLLCEDRELNTKFYIGVAVILASVFLHPLLRKRFEG